MYTFSLNIQVPGEVEGMGGMEELTIVTAKFVK